MQNKRKKHTKKKTNCLYKHDLSILLCKSRISLLNKEDKYSILQCVMDKCLLKICTFHNGISIKFTSNNTKRHILRTTNYKHSIFIQHLVLSASS